MNRNSALLVSLFLFVALSMVYAELVPWRQCPYPDPDTRSNCTIHEVYIDPCKESAEGKPCKLKRGVVGNMTFHYTPSFSSEKIQGRIFWASQVMDIPFLGMSPDACLSTSCPIEAGEKNTYHVEVPILKKYPVCLAGLLSVRFLSPGAASRSLRYRVSVVPSWCVSVRTSYESRFRVEEITRPLGFGVSRIRVKDKGDGIAGKHRRRPENSKRKTTNEERVDRLVGGRKTKRKERGEEQRRQDFPRIPERREFASSRIVCKYLRKYPQACFCLCPTPPASAPAIVSLFTLLTNVPVFPWKRSTPSDRAYRTIVSHTDTESSTKEQYQYEKKNSDATMHVNGHTTQDAKQETNEMLECETGSLLCRVADLERQSLAQRDEIVCLRATLADALRRIAQLEGREKREDERNERRNERIVSSPLRNGHVSLRSNQNSTPQKDIRLRQTGSSCLRNSSSSGSSQDIRDSISSPRRPVSYTHSSQLPQRRSVHYQSTGSLHSDSPSSSSVSPVPSPSPRATPLPVARSPTARSNGPPQSSLRRAKRWSSTGDFTHSPQNQGSNSQLVSNRFSASTKSLFNLFKPPALNNVKHGTRDMQYNEEESTVRMYLRGRPVVLYVPTPLMELYDLHKVSTPPQSKLKLDWVYGYRGRDCRSNLHLLPTGEIVYFVAAVVVLYNMEEHSQRHYLGHTDDIKCIAIHPNKLVVATGQVCGTDRRDAMPHIRIWNSVSLTTLCVIGNGEFDGSICCLSFSKADGGNYLCAIDETSDHNISIWDWQKGERGTKVTETKCSVDTVVCAEWHPLERNQIVSCGKGHVSFWSLDNGGMLYKRMGIFESREKPRYVTCVAFNQSGDVLTGDSNGNIIVWGRGTNTISKIARNIHEGSIFSICVLKDGFIVTGGGKDGKILYFDESLNLTGEEAQIEDHFGGIRTLAEGRGSQLLIGTTRNCILVGDVGMGFSPAMLGHAEEVWGLAAHPTLPQFATAGHDRLLQMWDSLSHTVVWSKDIGEQAQSIGFTPDGNVMVVGCTSGKWLAIDSETRELYTHHSDGSEPIQVVRFSPDGTLLALGSRDNYIYVYQVNEDAVKYSRVGRCMGHSSFITHLDWSMDGQYLRSNSGDYELLYWNPGVCRQIPQPSMMRDMDWASHTCVISFETIGIWPEGADGTDVNNCTRSGDSKLLATGDDFGKVKLFSYPACQPKSLCHAYGGHSSHVTNVSFLQDDTRLISTGGSDTSVLQWIVNY